MCYGVRSSNIQKTANQAATQSNQKETSNYKGWTVYAMSVGKEVIDSFKRDAVQLTAVAVVALLLASCEYFSQNKQ